MNNWVQHREKCVGNRPEVQYTSIIQVSPEPHIAIALSELKHDTGMSMRALVGALIEFALNYVELETKTINVIKFNTPAKDGGSNE